MLASAFLDSSKGAAVERRSCLAHATRLDVLNRAIESARRWPDLQLLSTLEGRYV